MRYTTAFCGRYSLATGTRLIAWFYIVLYLINIILNITSVDAVKSYKDNVDEQIDYDENKLLAFNYVCLTFGVVTILLSTAFLVKFSESEDFMHFMIKWNVVRCIFAFAAIIYVTVDMDHILTVALSSILITVDLCASTYFTGVMASYVKELEDPNWQVHSNEPEKTAEHSIYLVSHKRSLPTEEVSYFNEVASTASPRFVDISLDDDDSREGAVTDKNTTTTEEKPALDSGYQNVTPSEEMMVQEKTEQNSEEDTRNISEKESVECDTNGSEDTAIEKQDLPQSEIQVQETTDSEIANDETENPEVGSGKVGSENGVANVAFDAGETEPPSVVLIPASPVENSDLNLHTTEKRGDNKGEENPAFEQVDNDTEILGM